MNNSKNKYQDLSLFKLPDNFRGKNKFIVQIWWIVQSSIFRWSPQFMYGWRVFILRLFGAKIGKNCLIRPSSTFTYPWKVTIGDNVWIGDDVVLYSLWNIDIGSNVVISQNSYICAATHNYKSVAFDMVGKSVKIEDESWISSDVFVAPGICIAKGSVIGARSTILNNTHEGFIYYGQPAKKIKKRSD